MRPPSGLTIANAGTTNFGNDASAGHATITNGGYPATSAATARPGNASIHNNFVF